MTDFGREDRKDGIEYAVSACLCGIRCRYDGNDNCIPRVKELYESGKAVPVCPEVMGGMPTPREPSEINGSRVMNKAGEDVTEYFEKGAEAALEICLRHNIKKAILKQNSPSCGSKYIYDGTFSGRLTEGKGMAARLFSENGIEVFDEHAEFLQKFYEI